MLNPIPPAVYGTNAESCQCLLGHMAGAAWGVSQVFHLLLLDNAGPIVLKFGMQLSLT